MTEPAPAPCVRFGDLIIRFFIGAKVADGSDADSARQLRTLDQAPRRNDAIRGEWRRGSRQRNVSAPPPSQTAVSPSPEALDLRDQMVDILMGRTSAGLREMLHRDQKPSQRVALGLFRERRQHEANWSEAGLR